MRHVSCAKFLAIFVGMLFLWTYVMYILFLENNGVPIPVINDKNPDSPNDYAERLESGGSDAWKRKELENINDLVQRRLAYLQNPQDCDTAKKILCSINRSGAGYGMQFHDGVACLIAAYATQRTLILDSSNLRYTERGLDSIYQPLSKSCTSIGNQKVKSTTDFKNIDDYPVVKLPIYHKLYVHKPPEFLPFSVPADLAEKLSRVHENPSHWWVGIITSYITRLNEDMTRLVEDSIKISGFRHPIVGIHVRRTDKIIYESSVFDLAVYMDHVEKWFDKYEKTNRPVQRTVFLASDEPNVIEELTKRFPKYKFITNRNATVLAHSQDTRYSETSLQGLILDMEMLASCDFVVCKLTSNIARMVYERIYARHWDAPSRIVSIEAPFHFYHYYLKGQDEEDKKMKRLDNNLLNYMKIFRNITKHRKTDTSLITLDNEPKPVKMPTYPEVQ